MNDKGETIKTIKIIMRRNYNFWTYIVTNAERTVMYTGVTNNLAQRLKEHYDNRGEEKTFAGRYYCYNLVYYEHTIYINNAILREKEIKDMSREKKMAMITAVNPRWKFLNIGVCGTWPPTFAGRLPDEATKDNEAWWASLTPPPIIEE
jgi:putative endonuclease